MQNFYTYLHCKPNGDPFYVGKGYGERAHRLNQRNNWHDKIVSKYGKQNILIYVFPCESEEQAFADEKQQIAQLRREGYELCNLTDGGDGPAGYKFTEEQSKAHSEKQRGKKLSDQHKLKIGLSQLGRVGPMKNKKHSDSTRIKMSKSSIWCKENMSERSVKLREDQSERVRLYWKNKKLGVVK